MTVYVFPGQGSQIKGMGEGLFTEFSGLTQTANDILGYDISALCLTDANQQLDQTHFTQPALYVVSALSYLKKKASHSEKPHYLAGHSLGEYNALFAADVFDFATGLKLVKKRGELMSQAQGGGMAAIIGLTAETIAAILQEHQLTRITVANYNSYRQLVISGPKDDVLQAAPLFKEAGAKLVIPLKVSGAFHSPAMQQAAVQFQAFIQPFSFAAPRIPVIANINAKPYSPHCIAEGLVQQIIHPVQWTQTIHYLLHLGETQFEEMGPGKVLSGLIKRIQQGQ